MAIQGRRRAVVGQWGEERAAHWLLERGWKVVERNWRCPAGEVDIVARDLDGSLVLVEVKTRSGLRFGDPLESITVAKQRKLRDLAVHYRRSHPGTRHVRVDAIGVLRTREGVRIRHVKGALG